MNKKGFTLIELLAVIVILAIIALIAAPVILGIIDDARKSSAKNSAYGVIASGKLHFSNSLLNTDTVPEVTTDRTFTCADGVCKTNDNIILSMDGTVPTGTITISNNGLMNGTLTFNGKYTYHICNNKLEETECSNTPVTYQYRFGDAVTLKDDTTWMVVKDSITDEENIKLISTKIVTASIAGKTGTALFDSANWNGAYSFDTGNNTAYASSSIKTFLEGSLKTALQTSLGGSIINIGLMGTGELTAAGCSSIITDSTNFNSVYACAQDKFGLVETWTDIAVTEDGDPKVLFYFNSGGIGAEDAGTQNSIRPVITVSKTLIK